MAFASGHRSHSPRPSPPSRGAAWPGRPPDSGPLAGRRTGASQLPGESLRGRGRGCGAGLGRRVGAVRAASRPRGRPGGGAGRAALKPGVGSRLRAVTEAPRLAPARAAEAAVTKKLRGHGGGGGGGNRSRKLGRSPASCRPARADWPHRLFIRRSLVAPSCQDSAAARLGRAKFGGEGGGGEGVPGGWGGVGRTTGRWDGELLGGAVSAENGREGWRDGRA